MLEQLLQNSSLASFELAIQSEENLSIENLWATPKALIAALAHRFTSKNILLITSGQDEERTLVDLPNFTTSPVMQWPAWETLPGENSEPSPDIVGERASILNHLLKSKTSSFVVANLSAILTPLAPKEIFKKLHLNFKKGKELEFGQLLEKLLKLGYERVPLVNDKGQFALRGGILDVFSSAETEPFRVEFFGNEIESIRTFDPISQKSVALLDEFSLLPNKERELLQKCQEKTSLLSYLGENTLIILDRPDQLTNRYKELIEGIEPKDMHLITWDSFTDNINPLKKIYFQDDQSLRDKISAKRWDHPFSKLDDTFSSKTKIFHDQDQAYLVRLPSIQNDAFKLIYLCQNDAEEKSLKDQMIEVYKDVPKNVVFERGCWTQGFVLLNEQKAFVTSNEVTHRYAIKRKKQRTSYHSSPVEFMELEEGSHVVHLQHGIARFLGWQKQKNHVGIETDFLKLEYANKSILYVPLDQSHLVTKFIGAKHEAPKLHQIGGKQWVKTKVQTERAIMDYASELLRHYAQRELKEGFVYPEDSEDQNLFANEFPYVETVDQLQAIDAIKKDFQSSKPMDRLICGDVGYGKTEVAMRAAFKAVVDGGKQVAVLVPTTVLALQHFETFVQRMSNFPIRIGLLSRFVSPEKQKQYLKGLREGSIDIVIGTHRVIGKDVTFKDLGLVIVDEEQRFGVKAKEHLKSLTIGVDCLTLSATPIPRTLYMSLVGARDISVINSPPQDRLPIKTHLVEFDPNIIKQAILRELGRGGQVYIIHNRVQSIYEFGNMIKKLVPQIKMIIGHGQMEADELDHVFHSFKSKESNVLIATTIVENGIDIPEANTILIDRADRFGLADLYQLRGRVGRWNKKAYAYFLVPQNQVLRELADKRLKALLENSGYGGGMKVAMRDLEIRGAGDILGTSQSGQISAIGFHLYCKLLKRTILSMQGKAPKVIIETKVDFPFNYLIPEEYISDLSLRMELYQRLGEAYSFEELEKIEEEVVDRFGPYPEPFAWLYHLTRVKVYSGANRFISIGYKKVILKAERREKGEIVTYKAPFNLSTDPKTFEDEVIMTLKKW
ncbi:MAG: Transcription-repair-coupling factor [Chlamydiae bacterium]|nr:Transcription-repair-coupling factor [Chlamydiota bacterium]